MNWDQTGRCRQFDISAGANGDLALSLAMKPPVLEMTLFIVFPDGTWMFGEGSLVQRTTIPVAAGMTYRLVVMSYSPPQDFDLTTNFQAGVAR